MKQHFFITLEGIEGVGKSTVAKYMDVLLTEHGISHINTREPGGTPIAEAIRQVLLQDYDEMIYGETEALLLFAGRNQHIANVIKPALAKQQSVICDRFTDASYAYQGGGRGIAVEKIAVLENWVQGDLRPDLTFILDTSVDIALSRLGARGDKDRIEQEKAEFFVAIRKAYLERAHAHPQRYHIIDAGENEESVQQQIQAVLSKLYGWSA